MRLTWMLAVGLAAASPVSAQIPADVSMGFIFRSAAPPVVAGEVTEHLGDRLAVLGGGYWGSRSDGVASTVGFYGGLRLYTEFPGRFRPFGEIPIGFSQSRNVVGGRRLRHALTFTPGLGVEVAFGRRTRFRAAVSSGLALGGGGNGTGFNITTALVLIPAGQRRE